MTLHTTEPTCTKPSFVQHRAGHLCPVVYHHFREHGRRGQRYKRLFWKQIFGLQPISDLKTQFTLCDYLHNVPHIIWLIMNRNRTACLPYVNNVYLRMLGCVHCARLCVSALLCAFLLGCVQSPRQKQVWLCAMSSAPRFCDRREDCVLRCIPQ